MVELLFLISRKVLSIAAEAQCLYKNCKFKAFGRFFCFLPTKLAYGAKEEEDCIFRYKQVLFPVKTMLYFRLFEFFLPNYLLTALCFVHFFVLCYALGMAPFAKSVYSAVYLFSTEWK